jgi:MFS transporter, NRE family, putaive nickel resistance protein
MNPLFARLYCAQAINLIGDALTWLGLALLAFELSPTQSGTILAGALTLRVTAYVLLAPIAGVVADRCDRKSVMILTHLARMGLVSLLPFVTQVWQLYLLVLALNIFAAFFTPIYTATIPLVTTIAQRPKAIALSSATYQLLGVLGPGLAAGLAMWVGGRSIFWLDGLTFLIAAMLVATLPGQLRVDTATKHTIAQTLSDVRIGTVCLLSDGPMRYGLILQFVAAIVGAAILVNTIGYIQGTLHLGKLEYGWAMTAFGVGAMIGAIAWGNLAPQLKFKYVPYATIGAVLITGALLPANIVDLGGLLLLWAIAGGGQTLVNLPMQTLIADRVAVELQGRVYGAQFAWSHLGWAFAYPLAGWLGKCAPHANFWMTSLIGFGALITTIVLLPRVDRRDGFWHEHAHAHGEHSHNHLHFHSTPEITA